MGWTPPAFGQSERPFDPEDPYADPAALIEQRIKKTHEKMVQIEKAKVSIEGSPSQCPCRAFRLAS